MDRIQDIPVVNLLGVSVHKLTMQGLLDICDQHIIDHKPLLLGVVNVAKLVNCRKNPQLRSSVTDADLILADGQGVVWLSRWVGDPLPERVAGIDIMHRLLELADRKPYRVFFLGAKKEVVEKVVEKVRQQHPHLIVAGYRDGYFSDSDGEVVAREIQASRADILFVAMTSPKKENFLSRWSSIMGVSICHGVGGSFDVVAGVTRRAPLWMQKWGLEWFYRVLQEPGRMWKRYLVTNSIFLWLSIGEVFRQRFGKARVKESA
jgi:N-acetylglucosaminyldiphosphoundecaprenol N-acetyl-beta-D-mannosaminyltransferase